MPADFCPRQQYGGVLLFMVLPWVFFEACWSVRLSSEVSSMLDEDLDVSASEKTENSSQTSDFECLQFENISAWNHSVGPVLVGLCKAWPGNFPVQTMDSMLDALDDVFRPGGLWATMMGMAESVEEDQYCLRRDVKRPVLFNSTDEEGCKDMTQEGGSRFLDLSDTGWTGYIECEDDHHERCACTEDAHGVRTLEGSSGTSCLRQKTCYDHCPHGYKPTLNGLDGPTCTSFCADTSHPVPCGAGCANSVLNCMKIGSGQLGEGLGGAAVVMSLILMNPAIFAIADSAGDFVHFLFSSFHILYMAARQLVRSDDRKYTIMVLLTGFFTFCFEYNHFDDLGRNDLLMMTIDPFVDILDKFFLKGSMSAIADIILRLGAVGIIKSNDLTQSFQYPRCSVASMEVIFTIDNCGEERLLGPWMRRGRFAARPRYTKIHKTTERLQWSMGTKTWGLWILDKKTFSGKWLRWLGLGWKLQYRSDSSERTFPVKGWYAVKGAEPLPKITNAEDDGELVDYSNFHH